MHSLRTIEYSYLYISLYVEILQSSESYIMVDTSK